MVRTLICSLAGAGAGFVAGAVIVLIAAKGEPGRDTVVVTLFVGCFFAGTGAIAGAIIGGVADLLAYFRRKDQATRV